MLKCIGVSKEFGGLEALKKVDFTVNENEIAGLVGPNGSGKTTLLNVISGVYKPDSGKVLFMNEDISKLPPYLICSKGITKTSQSVQSFPDMTTLENVLAGVTSTFMSISTSASAVTDQIATIASLLLMRANILIEKRLFANSFCFVFQP